MYTNFILGSLLFILNIYWIYIFIEYILNLYLYLNTLFISSGGMFWIEIFFGIAANNSGVKIWLNISLMLKVNTCSNMYSIDVWLPSRLHMIAAEATWIECIYNKNNIFNCSRKRKQFCKLMTSHDHWWDYNKCLLRIIFR